MSRAMERPALKERVQRRTLKSAEEPRETQSTFKVVLQKSNPQKIRQLILFYYLYKEHVDEFVCALTFAKTSSKTLCVR